MTHILQDGVAWLAGKLQAHATETVVYRDVIGIDTSISANLSEETIDNQDQEGILFLVRRITCVITLPTIPILTNGKIVIDDKEWPIIGLSHKDSSLVVAQLERQEIREQSRPGYRKP